MMDITEKQFESQVKDLAKIYGWLYYHTWRSIHSPAGFPDVVMVRPPRLIFAELKSEKGQVSPKQQEWLDILRECQDHVISEPLTLLKGTAIIKLKGNDITYNTKPEVYLWRPSDMEPNGGVIAEILR